MPMPSSSAKKKLFPQRLLLVKLRHHGDVLLSTPIARLLKAYDPEIEIDMLVYEETRPILEGNQDINRIWTLASKERGFAQIKTFIQLWQNLRQRHYNCIIQLSEQLAIAWLGWLIGAPQRISFAYKQRQQWFWKAAFTDLIAEVSEQHMIEQNIATISGVIPPSFMQEHHELLTPYLPIQPQAIEMLYPKLKRLGVTGDSSTLAQPRWTFKGRSTEAGDHQFSSRSYIVLHAPARWHFKCWQESRMAAVAAFLAQKGWVVLLTAAPENREMAMVQKILDEVPKELKQVAPGNSEGVFSLAGELSLPELAALISSARLFLGVDSLPMHMAAALGVETVALFGPSKVYQWRPWGRSTYVIDARDFGSLIDPDAVDTKTQSRYLEQIPTAAVQQLLEKILTDPSSPSRASDKTSPRA